MNRKKLLLAILVLCFVGAVVWAVVRSPHQERVAQLKYRPGVPVPVRKSVKGAAPAAAPRDQGGLDTALLNRPLPAYAGFRRNIFSPIFREELKLPPVKSLPLPPRPLPLPPPPRFAAPPPPPPPPTPEQRDQAELARFTFLGFLQKDGSKTVFLSNDRKEIFLVKKGSTFAGKFTVVGLTDDALTLSTTSGGREMVIPLVENRSLIAQHSGRR